VTRSYAALRLLEHGPLSLEQFALITGWPYRSAQKVLDQLIDNGSVKRIVRGIYTLTS